jgi:hypothetical protein
MFSFRKGVPFTNILYVVSHEREATKVFFSENAAT